MVFRRIAECHSIPAPAASCPSSCWHDHPSFAVAPGFIPPRIQLSRGDNGGAEIEQFFTSSARPRRKKIIDGKTWRLHGREDAKILFKISAKELRKKK